MITGVASTLPYRTYCGVFTLVVCRTVLTSIYQAWHTSEGFAIQILERESENNIDYDQLNSTCAAWKSYVAASNLTQYDSGI
jgi:hypothetical protein